MYGDFTYVESRDDFNNVIRDYAYTPTKSSGRIAALSWGCNGNILDVTYMHGEYLSGNSDKNIFVRYRFDRNGPSSREYWQLVRERKASHIRMRQAFQLTEEAKGRTEARFEAVDPADGERLTDVFSLKGLSRVLDRLPCYR